MCQWKILKIGRYWAKNKSLWHTVEDEERVSEHVKYKNMSIVMYSSEQLECNDDRGQRVSTTVAIKKQDESNDERRGASHEWQGSVARPRYFLTKP